MSNFNWRLVCRIYFKIGLLMMMMMSVMYDANRNERHNYNVGDACNAWREWQE